MKMNLKVRKVSYFDDGRPLPPLSNTVNGSIFASVEVAGLAMRELINAVLKHSEDKLISRIIQIIPEKANLDPKGRNYIIDVVAETEDNEIVLLEVQMSPLFATNERSAIYGEKELSSKMVKSDRWSGIYKKLPRVIIVNILNFDLRKECTDFHQVIEPVYREEPRTVATKLHQQHNIQLPMFRNTEKDYTIDLHCWLTAICRAQDEGRSLREVVESDPELKRFAERSPGFMQYMERYQVIIGNRRTRREHYAWEVNSRLLEAEIATQKDLAEQHGIQIGEQRGEQRGIQIGEQRGIQIGEQRGIQIGVQRERTQHAKDLAVKMIQKNMLDEDIEEFTGLSPNEIQKIREQ